MVYIEIFENGDSALMNVNLPIMPRIGEYLAIENDYFEYFYIVEIWYRKNAEKSEFVPCARIERR